METKSIKDRFAVLEVVTDEEHPQHMKTVKLNGIDISEFVKSLNYRAALGETPEFTLTLHGYITGNGN